MKILEPLSKMTGKGKPVDMIMVGPVAHESHKVSSKYIYTSGKLQLV